MIIRHIHLYFILCILMFAVCSSHTFVFDCICTVRQSSGIYNKRKKWNKFGCWKWSKSLSPIIDHHLYKEIVPLKHCWTCYRMRSQGTKLFYGKANRCNSVSGEIIEIHSGDVCKDPSLLLALHLRVPDTLLIKLPVNRDTCKLSWDFDTK